MPALKSTEISQLLEHIVLDCHILLKLLNFEAYSNINELAKHLESTNLSIRSELDTQSLNCTSWDT